MLKVESYPIFIRFFNRFSVNCRESFSNFQKRRNLDTFCLNRYAFADEFDKAVCFRRQAKGVLPLFHGSFKAAFEKASI
jgi:hypothetical protein